MKRARSLSALLAACLASGTLHAQDLEPRAYSPAPIGTTFLLFGYGSSEGAILLDPSAGIENVQADLDFVFAGGGYTFWLAGRQARVLAVVPFAWGMVSGDVADEARSADLAGLSDPRLKLSVGLRGAPALTVEEFARTPRRTVLGASLTLLFPFGQYDARQLVNLGYNRWAIKPELGISHPAGRFTLEAYAGVWWFTTNGAYYPGDAVRRQDPVTALQGHVAYAVSRRAWLAVDGTWFVGGTTHVDGLTSPDRQRNARLGATLAIPIARRQSLKLFYSTGATTRRGSDFGTFSATWQLVRF
jgi:hypothetical protein